mgnify:CR=1 FL=1
METIRWLFFGYIDLLTSWWWMSFAFLTVFWFIALVLKENDYGRLSAKQAAYLACIGIIGLLPFSDKFLSLQDRTDFMTSWSAGFDHPQPVLFVFFFIVLVMICLILGPVKFLFVLALILNKKYHRSALAHDIHQHGIKQGIKLNFNL